MCQNAGWSITISTEEMRKHLSEREGHHVKRALDYSEQLKTFPTPEAQNQMGSSAAWSAVAQIKASIETHTREARRFAFIGTHITPQDAYTLSTQQCRELEFMD